MTSIIVFHEKHGDAYYEASTPELIARSCSKVLRARVADGYWYFRNFSGDSVLSKENQEIVDLTEAQLAALPASMRSAMIARRAKLVEQVEELQNEKEEEDQWFEDVDLVLSASDEDSYKLHKNLAYELLESRKDAEYEDFEIYKVN